MNECLACEETNLSWGKNYDKTDGWEDDLAIMHNFLSKGQFGLKGFKLLLVGLAVII